MDNPWKKLSSKTVYRNNWYSVREDEVIRPNGEKGIYAVLETPPSVFVIAQDLEEKIYLVKLFRYTAGQFSWELPAGSSDDENLIEASKRELQEESGVVAQDLTEIGTFRPFNGIASEISHVFLASNLKETGENRKEEEGIVESKKFSLEEILEMIRRGEIFDSQTISSIMLYLLYLKKL